MSKMLKRLTIILFSALLLSMTASSVPADKVTLAGGASKARAAAMGSYAASKTYVCSVKSTRNAYWYKFTTKSYRAFYTLTVKNNNINGWMYFYLLDPSEETVWDYSVHNNQSRSVNLKLKSNKTYYIRVSNNNKYAGYVQFNLASRRDRISDVKGTAASFKAGKTYNGTIDGNYDQDWYVVTPTVTSYYTLTAKNLNINAWTRFRLLDQYGEQLLNASEHSNQEYSATTGIKLKKGKKYYIVASVETSVVGNFRFILKRKA